MRSILLAVLGTALLLTPAWGQTKTPAKPAPAPAKPTAQPAAKAPAKAPAQAAVPAAPAAPAAAAPEAPPPGPDEDRFIDELLSQTSVQWGHAAWLAGRAAGLFEDSATPASAPAQAAAKGWGPAGRKAESPLDLQGYAFLLVKAFDIPTGLVYGWFPGPRYALRELTFRKVIPGGLDPESPVTGEEAMRYLQAAQDTKEALK